MKALLSLFVVLCCGFVHAASGIVESYKDSWARMDEQTVDDMLEKLPVNIVDLAFATFNQSYEVIGVECSDDELNHLVSQGHSKGMLVKISIGGATYGLSGILTSDAAASAMASSLQAYVEKYHLDGVDLDIEDYPEAQYQVALIKDLRDKLGKDKEITYTPKAPASTTRPYSEVIQEAHSYLDGINIMAYDTYPGYSYQDDVQGLIGMGVSADIITVGLMPGKDDVGGGYTSLEDISEAGKYSVDQGLRGLMIWDMDRDYTGEDGFPSGEAIQTAADSLSH